MQTKIEKGQSLGRPFHETIVDYINQASSAEMDGIALLVKMTNIPKGHGEIIAAWNRRRKDMCWGTEDLGLPAYLSFSAQKQAVMEKSNGAGEKDEKKSINLNNGDIRRTTFRYGAFFIVLTIFSFHFLPHLLPML